MVIKYYDNEELAYANRKRYKNFSFEPFNQEIQMSVLLGDGARTFIKTSSENICNYVTIDNTRWYVTSYEYLNGGQVRLNLQRDVVGEFGLSGGFGKIERGYTDGVLKFRKELNLNQRLVKRINIKPNSNNYGEFSVSTHDKEKWGIIYLSKPANSEDKISINIPEFNPDVLSDVPTITDGIRYLYLDSVDAYIEFYVSLVGEEENIKKMYRVLIEVDYNSLKTSYSEISNPEWVNFIIKSNASSVYAFDYMIEDFVDTLSEHLINLYSSKYSLPEKPAFVSPATEYNNKVVKENEKFYVYRVSRESKKLTGNIDNSLYSADNFSALVLNELFYHRLLGTYFVESISTYSTKIYSKSEAVFVVDKVKKEELSASESGTIEISLNENLVDEPFYILICPLYDVSISGTESFDIKKEKAFNIFNKVVQYLSGESGYLVDAQIYPYCPQLSKVGAVLENSFPFFSPVSSSFETFCDVSLSPFSDVKKEYIKREYSIISPDQSCKFNFNFYDYVKNITDNNGVNEELLTICVKTALKPFSIVSSAVLQPKNSSIKGITYESDLRGCNSSGGGFEVSLATDKYQEYIRQNSNYKQFFELQQEQLQRQHDVERVNEKTSAIVNTITATTMGAIGGASLGAGKLSKTAGAVTGSAVAGTAVGTAMLAQYFENEALRSYEEELQKQTFDLQIGTIKNLPISVSRVSSFNEIIMKDFNYIIETYECTEDESFIVDNFIQNYSYGIGVFDLFQNYYKEGWFIRGNIIKSNLITNLHLILSNELKGGIYLYE